MRYSCFIFKLHACLMALCVHTKESLPLLYHLLFQCNILYRRVCSFLSRNSPGVQREQHHVWSCFLKRHRTSGILMWTIIAINMQELFVISCRTHADTDYCSLLVFTNIIIYNDRKQREQSSSCTV